MKCQNCGGEYERKPKDTVSKWCPLCRTKRWKTYYLKQRQRRREREITQINFAVAWERWKRDFAIGKTQSNSGVAS